jgi:antitoxin component of RelBE/YafQ-DinJ toxin-antitoxin module
MSETIIPVPVDERMKQDADAALAPLGLTIVEVLRRAVEEIARGNLRLDLRGPEGRSDESGIGGPEVD